ncbi:pre-rRNA-processing protein ESF1 [Suillus subluteus]|nr:pre-rRNA-processing protein ESF1 [Suillus subluteus]
MPDPRFAQLKTDPLVVDECFKGIFDEGKARKKKLQQKGKRNEKLGRVDKFGRKISETPERTTSGEDKEAETPTSTIPDYARGGVLMESSESEAKSQGAGDSDNVSNGPGFVTLGRNLDEEGDNSKEAKEKIRRLAIVNLDWDHVRAAHLYKIVSSLVSTAVPATLLASVSMRPKDEESLKNTKSAKATVTRVLSVRVYPSELGKERIAREEKEGPRVEVFKKKIENEEDVNERTVHETGDGAYYHEDALRKYQLERLRYYYAIVECDTAEAVAHIYNELERTELQRSANVFNLSLVPDEMAFDEECRHTIVNQKEIEEADFKVYIASSFSESNNDPDPVSKKRSKKNAQRDKLRTLLLAGDDDELPEGWGRDDDAGKHDDVDMEITFTTGLTEAKIPEDETTVEAYQREMREKRREEGKVKAMTNDESGGQPGKKRRRAERKKRGKKKVINDDDGVQDDFIIDVKDDRFKANHEDYQFAISETSARPPTKVDDTSLKNPVESVKRKSAAADRGGFGKRRKL